MASNFQARHYNALAEAFANARNATDHTNVVDMVAEEVAYVLMNDNPRFDAERFYAAIREENQS